MKIRLCFGSLLVFLFGILLPVVAPGLSSPVFAQAALNRRANPMVHQQGQMILDAENRPVKLRTVALAPFMHWEGYLLGGNLLTSQSDIIKKLEQVLGKEEADRRVAELMNVLVTEQDVERIASDGFNCVRVPINYRYFANAQSPGWLLLDRLVGWCQKYGVYAIVDLHDAPGGQSRLPTADPDFKGLWRSRELQDETVALWRNLAAHYRNNQTVAGYDILNEPQAPRARQLITLYGRIIRSIRSVDPDHMIIVEGVKLASDFSPFRAPLCDNMIYSFHLYTWFGDNRAKKLKEYAQFAHSQNVPMWVGEYGENKDGMIASTLQMFASQDYIVGWSYWPWKRGKGTYPIINLVEIPESWRAVMKWVGNPLKKKPSAEQAEAAILELEKAVLIGNTSSNVPLLRIIRQY